MHLSHKVNQQWPNVNILPSYFENQILAVIVDNDESTKAHNYSFFSCVSYVPEPDDMKLLKTSLAIYRKFDRYPEAMKIAIQLNDVDLIKEVFLSCSGR